jgi:hypothetical protein
VPQPSKFPHFPGAINNERKLQIERQRDRNIQIQRQRERESRKRMSRDGEKKERDLNL